MKGPLSPPAVTKESPGIRLHCLGGQAPAAAIVDDLRQFDALPIGARQRLWTVLGPSLREPLPADIGATVDAFVKAHQIEGDALVRTLKAARALIRQAILLDLSPQQLGEDLTKLSGGGTDLGEVILAGYARAKAWLRSELVVQTVADHGKVVEDLRWRVDMMIASQRGGKLRQPVATVTLRYRDGRGQEQLTLQLLPDTLRELRSLCDSVLEPR